MFESYSSVTASHEASGNGETMKLLAPQFVKPYVKKNGSDARDAEALCAMWHAPSRRRKPTDNPERIERRLRSCSLASSAY